MINKQDNSFMYYIVIMLFLSIVTLEFYITVVFNDNSMERVKVKTGRTSKPSRGRKREELSDTEWGKLKGEELLNKIEDKEEW